MGIAMRSFCLKRLIQGWGIALPSGKVNVASGMGASRVVALTPYQALSVLCLPHETLTPSRVCGIGIPAVMAHQLEALIGNMLGDGRDEVAGAEDLEVTPNPGIEARAVDDRFPRVVAEG